MRSSVNKLPKHPGSLSGGLRRFLKNRLAVISAAVFLLIVLSCIFAPLIADEDPFTVDLSVRLTGSDEEHILGADALGRDLFARILYGGRYTLGVAFYSLALGAFFGTVIGILIGFYGGTPDSFVMRIVEAVSAVPAVLLVVAAECAFGWGVGNYAYAIAVSFVPPFVKVMRSAVMNIMSSEYIEAARALGISNGRIILRHVLHNVVSPFLVQVSSSTAEALLTCTIMGYLGFGFDPPTPEWGELVASGYSKILLEPVIGVAPCVAIAVSVLALNLVGNGLRDAFDPDEKTV